MMLLMMTMVSNESPLGPRSPNENVDSAVRHHIDTSEDGGTILMTGNRRYFKENHPLATKTGL